MSHSRCLLGHLENPNLSGILLGLDPRNGYRFREGFLECCDGRGILWDEMRQANRACSVKTRHRKTIEVIKKYMGIWGDSDLPLPTGTRSHQILSHVADMLKGAAPQAQIFPSISTRPGPLWSIACALTWRFGMDVHVVSLLRKGETIDVPSPSLMEGSRPLAILCEQVRRLSDPHEISQLESLINLAYQGNAYLWIEVMTQRPASNVRKKWGR